MATTATRTHPRPPGTEVDAAPARGIASLDERGLDALIERVEEAIEHDLALSGRDLALLLDALVTLAALTERLEHNDLTIAKLRKLLGIVRSSEKLSDLAGSLGGEEGGDGGRDEGAEEPEVGGGKGARRRKSPPRRKPPTAPPRPTVIHHPISDLERGSLCPGCAHGKLYKYEPSEFTRIVGHPPYSAERHVSETLRCNGCGQIHRASLPPEVLADGEPGQAYGYSARTVMAIAKYFDGDPFFRLWRDNLDGTRASIWMGRSASRHTEHERRDDGAQAPSQWDQWRLDR